MKASRAKPGVRTVPFDAADFLDDEELRLAYLNAVLADGDAREVITALGTIARSRGMSRVASDASLGRESLYKALSPGAKPRYDTVLKVIRALGISLHAETRTG